MRLDRRRTSLAAAVAPAVLPLLVGGLELANGVGFSWGFLTVGLVAGSSYAGMFFIGLPAILILRHFGQLNLVTLALVGICGGILTFFCSLTILGLLLGSSAAFGTVQVLWGATLGLAVALSFGAIAGITIRSTGPVQRRGARVRRA